ncbi:MAG: ATP-binding cassette domain-containing protein [Acidobacteriota bacterium]|nr:ATP-binding cassette domain-containing protein [Acidobacteriota bacterium]
MRYAIALSEAAWPDSRLFDCLTALLRKSGLGTNCTEEPFATPTLDSGWVDGAARRLGCEAEKINIAFRDIEEEFAVLSPALIRISETSYVAVLQASRKTLSLLTPSLKVIRLPIQTIARELREPFERKHRAEVASFLESAGLPEGRRIRTTAALLREEFAERRFDQCWIFRGPTGAAVLPWLGQANTIRRTCALISAHAVQYLLWLASWAILGTLSFEGRLDSGWLAGWALLLASIIPFRVFGTWTQGEIVISLGGLLKRRLLCGVMRLQPEEVKHQGIGSFLGQALEAEALETLALGGGIAGLLALVELALAAVILGPIALLLAGWTILTGLLAWRFLKRTATATDTRIKLTHDTVESMIGHRTRLAQQPISRWHDSEDRSLDNYLHVARSVDHSGALLSGIPRGWLIAGIACLAPSMATGQFSNTHAAVILGGILLAFTGFDRLVGSFTEIAAACVSWKRIAPLFQAASRPEKLGQAVAQHGNKAGSDTKGHGRKILDVDRLTFRYRKQGNPVIQGCSLTVRFGDRILIEGPSGGGKTTLASLLSGVRQADSGLLLADSLDVHTLGTAGWRERVGAAPQFHENHVLTETLAFNLLMGKQWPPSAHDMREAEIVCRELGLGDLLDRMPSGLMQMVGEGGWQLSHGERSRVYIARALLQNPDLIILDESFGALDPENLRIALQCTLDRAKTLMVIAHP